MAEGGLPELLDENWLHVWYYVLGETLPLLPALHRARHPLYQPLDPAKTCVVLERVCRRWPLLLLRSGVWRAFYQSMLFAPLSTPYPMSWFRLAALNFAIGGVHRPDFIQFTRACPPPPKPLHGALSSMILPTVLLNDMGVDWQYVTEGEDGRLLPYSWGADATRPWYRVKR